MFTHGSSGYVCGCRCEVCKEGNRAYHRAYRQANLEKVRAYHREYRRRNPPKPREYDPDKARQYAQARQQRIRETHENRDLLPGRDRKAIKPIEIFERDGWVCHICREPIDPEARHPDVRAASVDHVVSLANGGTHTRDNMAASHLICNMRKSI